MENPIKMDDLGGNTPIFGNTHLSLIFLKQKMYLWIFTWLLRKPWGERDLWQFLLGAFCARAQSKWTSRGDFDVHMVVCHMKNDYFVGNIGHLVILEVNILEVSIALKEWLKKYWSILMIFGGHRKVHPSSFGDMFSSRNHLYVWVETGWAKKTVANTSYDIWESFDLIERIFSLSLGQDSPRFDANFSV